MIGRNSTSSPGTSATVVFNAPQSILIPEGVYVLQTSILRENNPRRVSWSDDTIDNENLNKKKSNGKSISTIDVISMLHSR
jgi:hypothetical protein